jgi:hypothetical protein
MAADPKVFPEAAYVVQTAEESTRIVVNGASLGIVNVQILLVVWWPDQITGPNAKYTSDDCTAAQKASRHPAIPSFDHENRQLDQWIMVLSSSS